MSDNNPSYFEYLNYGQMAEIGRLFRSGADEWDINLRVLSIIYDVDEEILKKMKMSDIHNLMEISQKGSKEQIEREKKILSYIDKEEMDRFKLLDLE